MDYLIFFIFGIVIGSFLNVCIYRIPLGESIVAPPSHCTQCGTRLKPLDLIPIFSWLFLKGRCRYCGTSVSPQYVLVELVTGGIFVFAYNHLGFSPIVLVFIFLACILLVCALIDMKHYIIPDILNIVGIMGFLIFNLTFNFIPWQDALLGGILGASPLFLIVLFTKGKGMGMGDVKLMGMVGLYMGWKMALLTVFLSFVLGGIIGVVLLLAKIKNRHDPIPFGPWISLAAFLVMFYGYAMLYWYLDLIGIN
ncbi:MAG: prepilin peptidase [Eubacteriales bacterium]